MCCNFTILKQTENGMLLHLIHCNKYQLNFKNLNFNFSKEEYDSLFNYLKSIDCNYWETEYKNSIYEKKIPIPTPQANFIISIDRFELYEILNLLNFNTIKDNLKSTDINYPMNLN